MSDDLDAKLNKVVTDVNEDKWKRTLFPQNNNSNSNTIRSVSKLCDEKLESYLSDTRGTNMPNSATVDMTRHNDQLNTFTDKIRREFEQIQKTKRFPGAGYRFPISNDPLATSFVMNPEQISPLLKTSEERIKALQEEMSLREKDVLKMSGMINLLLDENKYLRDHVATKNKDMAKMLDTVGLNDGESVHNLRHRLNLLSEENNLLLAHLEELKASKNNMMTMTHSKDVDFNSLMESYKECRENLEDALKREQALANFKHTIEPKYRHAQDKVAELEMNVSELVEEVTQLKTKHLAVSNQGAAFKKKISELENKNTDEIDQYIYEVNTLKNEKSELKRLLDAQQKLEEERENEFRRVRKEFEGYRLENEELVQTVNQLKNQLANEKQDVELAEKKEIEFKEKNKQLILELERLKGNTTQSEYENRKALDSAVADFEAKQSKLEQKLAKVKSKHKDALAEKDEKISYLELKLKEANRISSRLESERDEYFQKIQEYAAEKGEMLQREKFMGGLEIRAESLQRELASLREDRDTIDKRYRDEIKSLKDDIFRLNDTNRQLMDEVATLKRKASEQQQRPARASSMDFRNEGYESQRKRQRLRGTEVEMNFEDNNDREALHEARKSLNNVEQENEYLRLLLKNTVVAGEEEQQQKRARPRPSCKERPTSVSPSKKENRRTHISYDIQIQNRPSHRSIVSGYRDIADMSLSRIEVPPVVLQQTHHIRRSSVAEPSSLLNTSGVERVVNTVLKKYNMEKPPNIFGYKGLSDGIGAYDLSRTAPINRDALGAAKNPPPNMTRLALNKHHRSLPMSPDKDKDGKKLVIQEIIDDPVPDYL